MKLVIQSIANALTCHLALMWRRQLILVALIGYLWPLIGVVNSARAQDFPNQSVKIIVPLTPGGANDVLARTLAEKLGGIWRQSVVVDNRPGASGNIGAMAVARSASDGHTLLVAPNNVFVINHSISPRLQAARDLTPITMLGTVPFVLVAGNSLKVNSVKDLVELSKSRPSGLSYASSGVGSPQHLAAEMFRMQTGARLTHVPYKGAAPAITDLLGGQVDIQFGAINQLIPHIRDGRLKALAIAGNERVALLPEVPTLTETGVIGRLGEVWIAMAGPANMPAKVVEQVSRAVHGVLSSPEVKARMAEQGIVVKSSSPSQLGQLIDEDSKRWAQVIKEANIKSE